MSVEYAEARTILQTRYIRDLKPNPSMYYNETRYGNFKRYREDIGKASTGLKNLQSYKLGNCQKKFSIFATPPQKVTRSFDKLQFISPVITDTPRTITGKSLSTLSAHFLQSAGHLAVDQSTHFATSCCPYKCECIFHFDSFSVVAFVVVVLDVVVVVVALDVVVVVDVAAVCRVLYTSRLSHHTNVHRFVNIIFNLS